MHFGGVVFKFSNDNEMIKSWLIDRLQNAWLLCLVTILVNTLWYNFNVKQTDNYLWRQLGLIF